MHCLVGKYLNKYHAAAAWQQQMQARVPTYPTLHLQARPVQGAATPSARVEAANGAPSQARGLPQPTRTAAVQVPAPAGHVRACAILHLHAECS